MRIDAFERVARLVGDTPLVEISQSAAAARILAKLEYYNPSGSVKDRAAKGMLEAALADGALAGRTILEATSGNTGIALAMFGSALGLPVELVMPANVTPERKRIIANYGARSLFTSNLEGTDGAQKKAAELAAAHPERYFYPDQYNNEHNWRAHYAGTGPEIWRQSGGRATHFVAGLGTSGTFIGTARFLREQGVRCIAVQPDNPIHGLEGWKHMPTARVPGIYDDAVADEVLQADTETAYRFAIAAGRYLGYALSPSAAANLWAALEVARGTPGATVVTLFPDNSLKYLDDPYWDNDDYVAEDPFRSTAASAGSAAGGDR